MKGTGVSRSEKTMRVGSEERLEKRYRIFTERINELTILSVLTQKIKN